ncbi:MAG TPA: hypothetical protein ENN03_01430 [bacterium]|nr:hypothetical protein [bacterium]
MFLTAGRTAINAKYPSSSLFDGDLKTCRVAGSVKSTIPSTYTGASGGVLDADLRSATTDRGPQTAAAFGRDDGPQTIDHGLPSSVVYGLWSEHRPPSRVEEPHKKTARWSRRLSGSGGGT